MPIFPVPGLPSRWACESRMSEIFWSLGCWKRVLPIFPPWFPVAPASLLRCLSRFWCHRWHQAFADSFAVRQPLRMSWTQLWAWENGQGYIDRRLFLVGGFKHFLIFTPTWGKWSNLNWYFQMGWNNQLDLYNCTRLLLSLAFLDVCLKRNLYAAASNGGGLYTSLRRLGAEWWGDKHIYK